MRIFDVTRIAGEISLLRNLGTACVYVQRVQRLAGRQEETVFLRAAEAEVRAGFRQANLANQLSIGRDDLDAVVVFPTPSRTGPDVAIHVAADAVEASFTHVEELAAIGQAHAVNYVIYTQLVRVAGILRSSGIDDVELLLVWREADTVGFVHVAGDDSEVWRLWIEAVDITRELKCPLVTFVVAQNSVSRIGEPNCAVRMHRQIVGCIERLSLIAVG